MILADIANNQVNVCAISIWPMHLYSEVEAVPRVHAFILCEPFQH